VEIERTHHVECMSKLPTPPTPPGPDGLRRHYTGAEVVFTPSIAYLDELVARVKARRLEN
jgi:hypothetical protein